MKKSIFLAVCFSIFSGALLTAQNIALGARTGIMWNSVVSNSLANTIDFKTISTSSIGLVADVKLTDNISFHPELNYTEKGFKTNIGKDLSLLGVQLPLGARAATVVKYVDAPLTIKYKFGNTEGVSFYAMAGPTVGYALSGKLETSAKVIIDIKIASTPIDLTSQNYTRFEVGGILGAGMNVPVGNGNFYIDARYTRSFQDVYEVPVVGAKVRNKGFGIGLGYVHNF
jgi:Outer membrane protein beta-barrel domain